MPLPLQLKAWAPATRPFSEVLDHEQRQDPWMLCLFPSMSMIFQRQTPQLYPVKILVFSNSRYKYLIRLVYAYR